MDTEIPKKYAWLTDIHLDFLPDWKTKQWLEELHQLDVDGFFITGDISTVLKSGDHLYYFESIVQKPIYFVLGNHDYYGVEFDKGIKYVRKMVRKMSSKAKWLNLVAEN